MFVHSKEAKLSTFALVMIAVGAIMSPIGMVIMAQYGLSSVVFYTVVILLFFIPSAWVCSELASAWPEEGGIYHWMAVAFGRTIANICLWLQWLAVLVSFPVILTFVAGIVAYTFEPSLIHNGKFVVLVCVSLTVIATWLSLQGIKGTYWAAMLASIFATIFPAGLLIIFAIVWLLSGNHSATPIQWSGFLPHYKGLGTFALLGATVFMFAGIEIAAYCLRYVKDARRQYAKAVVISAVLIAFLSVVGTVAIAILLPAGHRSLVAALMQSYLMFLDHYHLHVVMYLLLVVALAGWMGVIATYLSTLSMGLLAASKDHMLPRVFSKVNKKGVAANLLYMQAIVAIIISLSFVLEPQVRSAYWLIEASVAVASGVRYIFLFIAAILLRYSHANAHREIKIPGGNWGMWLVAGAGIVMCAFATVMTFVPPAQFSVGDIKSFEWSLATAFVLFLAIPYLIGKYSQHSFKKRAREKHPDMLHHHHEV